MTRTIYYSLASLVACSLLLIPTNGASQALPPDVETGVWRLPPSGWLTEKNPAAG